MAYSDLVIDQTTEQCFLLSFADKTGGYAVASSYDGDFTTNPITINRPYFTGADFKAGCTPSSTLSCSLENSDYKFSGFSFGYAQAYIGVLYSETASQGAGRMATLYGGTVELQASLAGNMEVQGTEVPDTTTTTFVICHNTPGLSPGTLYFVDDNGDACSYNFYTATKVTLGTPSAFFSAKAAQEEMIVCVDTWTFDDNSGYGPYASYSIFSDDVIKVFQIAPVGRFNIAKPTSTSTRVVEINSAYDSMGLLDRTAGGFVASVQALYPGGTCTLSNFVAQFVSYTGVQITIPIACGSYNVRTDLFSGSYYTLREIVSFIAEACCGIASSTVDDEIFSGLTVNVIYDQSVSPIAQIPTTQIVADGYNRADYYVHDINAVELYKSDGSYWESSSWGLGDNNYVISNNPIIDENTLQDAGYLTTLKKYTANTYHPISVDLTELDPTLTLGKPIEIQNIYDNSYDKVPLWEMNILWCGKTYGSIIAGGNEYRITT